MRVPAPSALRLRVDLDSPVPPYEQVRSQIADLVSSGALASGVRLPSVRQLAGDLGIAAGTVARAYKELEENGAVVGRGRHGTVVRQDPPIPDGSRRQEALDLAAEQLAVTAQRLGFNMAETQAALRQAIGQVDAAC